MSNPMFFQHSPRAGASRRALGSFLFMITAAIALTGCPGGAELENADDHIDQIVCDTPKMFTQSCRGSICHQGADADGGVDLTSPGVEARLLDVDATYPQNEGCRGAQPPQKLIDSANPEASLMLLKTLGTHDEGCGEPMPNQDGLTNEVEMACLQEWVQQVIDQGAGGTP